MNCQRCGSAYGYVSHTESSGGMVKRTRRCVACGNTWETVEVASDVTLLRDIVDYTGWTGEVAQAAIAQLRRFDPDWIWDGGHG